MPSSRLSDYDLGEVLGMGTVGTIYAAVERETGTKIAVKKLHPAVSQDKLIRARFKREMMILGRLRHNNIVAYYGGGDDEGQLYYMMELVDGGTVKELLEASGALPWPVVVDIGRQICSALQFAHNHGVIHRDLKPGNLFLTRDAEIKLGDFGIARDVNAGDLTADGLTVGTHAYMSPEQITGDTLISGKTDLYALGCCLFEMVSGRKPFLGDNFAQLFEQHLRVPPPKASSAVGDCPPELDEVIDQLMAKSPDDRPFNARHVQGCMLQIGEKYGLNRKDDEVATKRTDVAAGNVPASPKLTAAEQATLLGHRILKKQINVRLGGGPRSEVSWGRFLIVAGIILVVILVAAATQYAGPQP